MVTAEPAEVNGPDDLTGFEGDFMDSPRWLRIGRRSSVRTWLGLIALVGLGLAIGRWWNDPAVRYRRDGSADALSAVLVERVRNGDPVAKLESWLGSAGHVSIRGYRAVVEADARRSPEQYPDGVRPDDEFLSYDAGRTSIVLQARAGRLVNFNPADYPVDFGPALSR